MQRPELLLMAAGSDWEQLRARAQWLEQRQLLMVMVLLVMLRRPYQWRPQLHEKLAKQLLKT